MPHLVEMQKKYGPQGLVVMSVHVEFPDHRTDRQKIVDFLKKADIRLVNYYLDEVHAFWSQKFRTEGTPFVFLFDRRGKWVQFGTEGEVDHDKVEATVKQFLQER